MSNDPVLQYDDILEALKSQVNSNTFGIFVPSIQRSIPFRQITVEEQKFISKRGIEDSSVRSSYEVFIALISKLCVDKTIDVLSFTELDRIKILIELFRKNYNINKYGLTCPACKHAFQTAIDFDPILSAFDKFDSTPLVHTVLSEISKSKYTFTLYPPSIKAVRAYNQACVDAKHEVTVEPFERSDFYRLFIKKIEVVKEDGQVSPFVIDFNSLTYVQIENVLNLMPVDAIYSEAGVVGALSKNYMSKFSDIKSDVTCPKCSHVIVGAVSPSSFFQ